MILIPTPQYLDSAKFLNMFIERDIATFFRQDPRSSEKS